MKISILNGKYDFDVIKPFLNQQTYNTSYEIGGSRKTVRKVHLSQRAPFCPTHAKNRGLLLSFFKQQQSRRQVSQIAIIIKGRRRYNVECKKQFMVSTSVHQLWRHSL
ncbi:hypothetical protein Y032_0045g1212 [Ancylostoma ceylanicum]|uniref:Uncharacterized protein n=1 Tax=Ancylostoma ceylanicum TaxID=53326 RepID=A0A016UDN3_9BILA|nr:hypothetical protein Y032_0045g1212 [Ancylostoma ceylanicum]